MIFFLPFSRPRELSQAPAPLLEKKRSFRGDEDAEDLASVRDPGLLSGALIGGSCVHNTLCDNAAASQWVATVLSDFQEHHATRQYTLRYRDLC